MAPWGGAEPLLGTNPIAVAIPSGKEAPVVLDIATSVASNGSIRAYALEGKPMPEGWVISRADGKPITDGRRLAEGMFVPLGGYKGSGLALVLGLLAGPLNRAAFGRDIKDVNTEQASETNTGQFVIALDVARSCRSINLAPRSTAICATSHPPRGSPGSTKSAFPDKVARSAGRSGK
jgi:LDH2 family malate/lactate/ureidoglycolate dehydrogenase